MLRIKYKYRVHAYNNEQYVLQPNKMTRKIQNQITRLITNNFNVHLIWRYPAVAYKFIEIKKLIKLLGSPYTARMQQNSSLLNQSQDQKCNPQPKATEMDT